MGQYLYKKLNSCMIDKYEITDREDVLKIGVYFSEICEEITHKFLRFVYKKEIRYREEKNHEIAKWYFYTQVLLQWMWARQKGHGIAEYLERYDCEKIAVYGMGEIGRLCIDEFLESRMLKIPYVIDRMQMDNYRGIPVILPEEIQDDVDAVIITPVYCYMEIADVLCKYTKAKLISLEDIFATLNERESI